MPQQASRSARIEARIAPDALRVVRRAAELQGRSLSDFVVAAAQEVAHRTIDEAQIIHLSVEDQQRFVEPPFMYKATVQTEELSVPEDNEQIEKYARSGLRDDSAQYYVQKLQL